ncbi:MAG: glycerate kinase [Muribaculaceae bacterium]|nr:glycerate kinase [Muribaculaceae bacterium]
MAILIAPDKYKGTLTAREATDIIAGELSQWPCIKAPMADGGEGTALALCSGPGWEERGQYFINPLRREAVIDSSAVVGIRPGADILALSSAPLGVLVKHLIEGESVEKVIIGVGGTGMCDGGVGFLRALGDYKRYADRLLGLCDVAVPLLPQEPDGPSALMFAPQKGATEADIPVLRERLEMAMRDYGHGLRPFDGAGGGLGFAIGNAIGAPCVSGARYVLDHLGIDWREVSCVVTGEGRVDDQTAQGKVVSVLSQAAAEHGVPCFVLAGCISGSISSDSIIDASAYIADAPLTPAIAAARLSHAARQLILKIKTL